MRANVSAARTLGTMGALALMAVTASGAPAQVVRGSVVDAEHSAPIAGAIVSLLSADGRTLRSVLSGDGGRFALRAPDTGSYHAEAKRIGFEPVVSPRFTLAAGEMRELRLRVSAVRTLPPVHVSALTKCRSDQSDGAATAALWEDVRAALTATRLTQEDGSAQATIVRYTRTLDPRSLRVRAEQRHERKIVTGMPFSSVPAAQLSREGYVHRDATGATWYRAPDAEVLLSARFLSEHCFRMVSGTRENLRRRGLAFEPVPTRKLPDVAGVLWVDDTTTQLRALEFRYVGVEDALRSDHIGGRVEFWRLPSGAWIVNRWYIRMPVMQTLVGVDRTGVARAGDGEHRTRLIAIAEDGGEVVSADQESANPPSARATVDGVVSDSTTGAPLAGARVFLSGTSISASTDASGRFRLESPMQGDFDIVFSHPRLDSLGLTPPPRRLALVVGKELNVMLAIPSWPAVMAAICPPLPEERDAGIVRGRIRSSMGAPVGGARVRLTWPIASRKIDDAEIAARSAYIEEATDADGDYTLCGVPAEQPLELSVTTNGRVEHRRVQAIAQRVTTVELTITP